MKKVSCICFLGASLAMTMLFACAKAPVQEVSVAKSSLEAAKAMKADVFAVEQFAAAQSYFDAATAEITTQNAKSPFSRNYETSLKILKEAIAAADAAKSAVTANKAKLITEVKASLSSALALAAETKNTITEASKKNKGAALLSAKIDSVVNVLPKDSTAVTEDNALTVQENLKTVGPQIDAIKTSLQELLAAAPVKGKKK